MSFLFGLLNLCLPASVQHFKASSQGDRQPCQFTTTHRGQQDQKRQGGEDRNERNKDGNTPDTSYKRVIEILLAKQQHELE